MKVLRIEIREKETGNILAHGWTRENATEIERRKKARILHDRITLQECDTYVVERIFEDGKAFDDICEGKYCSTEINERLIIEDIKHLY